MSGVPAAEWVEVEPLSASDWEVVDSNAGWLEEALLAQVRGAVPGLPAELASACMRAQDRAALLRRQR